MKISGYYNKNNKLRRSFSYKDTLKVIPHSKFTDILFIFIVSILFISSIAKAETNIDINGYIRNETGVLLNEDTELGLMKNTLNLDLTYRNDDDTLGAKATPYIYYYGEGDYKMDLRELYIDIYLDSVDIRVGKQQIMWGKADGVFITDVVSPKNLTEFLLPEFTEIRMGVNSIKLDYSLDNKTLEFVFTPMFTATQIPLSDSIWGVKMDLPKGAIIDKSKMSVKPSLENSEFFIKYSLLSSAIDFEVMGGYMWDDEPTLHMKREKTPTGPKLTITPEHHRLGLLGGGFSKDISGLFVLRGEVAFYYNKYFLLENFVEDKNTTQKSYVHYLVGLDATPFWDIKMSAQFVQRAILNYDSNIQDREFDNTMTFLMKKTFLRETLDLELFTYYSISNGDALIKPKISYKYTDELELSAGAYIFVGDKDGMFGQFEDNNMIYVKSKLTF